jgi:TonB family protein
MKKLFLISALLLVGLFLSMKVQAEVTFIPVDYEIFPSCLNKNNNKDHTVNDAQKENIQQYKSIKKKPPRYPKNALDKGMEGVVILEYTINNEGKTKDIKVVDSSNDIFNNAAIKTVSQFIYEPSINLDTGLTISTPGVEHAVSFRLKGADDILRFSGRRSGNFNREIDRIQNLDPKEAIERILFKLPNENDPLKKAVYYYLKSLRASENEPRNLLVEKEDLQVSYSLLKQEVISIDPNVLKLRTYVIPSLAYLEVNDEKAMDLLEESISILQRYNFPPSTRVYSTYANFGVLAYNSGNWCGAYKSFDTAIDIAKNIGLEAPPEIEQYRDLAKQKF